MKTPLSPTCSGTPGLPYIKHHSGVEENSYRHYKALGLLSTLRNMANDCQLSAGEGMLRLYLQEMNVHVVI